MANFRVSPFWLLPSAAFVHPTYAIDYLSVTEAQKALFAAAESFKERKVTLTDDQISAIKQKSGVRQRTKTPQIWQALKGGKPLGWFLIDDVIGKHEYITYALAVDMSGQVINLEIMSYRETHGGEVREASWRNNFKGKKVSDPFKLDVDVPNISGATLSSRNILDGVKRQLVLLQEIGNG